MEVLQENKKQRGTYSWPPKDAPNKDAAEEYVGPPVVAAPAATAAVGAGGLQQETVPAAPTATAPAAVAAVDAATETQPQGGVSAWLPPELLPPPGLRLTVRQRLGEGRPSQETKGNKSRWPYGNSRLFYSI